MKDFLRYITSKADTQQMIKALRSAGVVVNKVRTGYCTPGQHQGEPLFKAMTIDNGYMIKRHKDLFN